MRRWIALLVLIVPSSVYSATLATSWTSVANLPRRFERNVGQAPPASLYISHGMGRGDVALGQRSVRFCFPAADGHSRENVEMTFLRSRTVQPLPEARLDTTTNYFFGKEPDRWRSGVPNYERVRYSELYPGIDLIVYGRESAVEYDFVIAPKHDPSAITLGFRGVRRLTIDANGDLLLITRSGELRQKRPRVYQTVDGQRHQIEGKYVRRGRNRVGFAVGTYDQSQPLVIDPLLVYSFSFGGSSDERPTAIAVDSSGNAYITGTTKSADFPTVTPYQSAAGGGVDSFIAKLNAAGTALVYATYIGGSGDDTAAAIAIDSSGNAYVAGKTTSTNFPTAAALYATLKGSSDAFVLKLSASGGALTYSTYLGGTSDDDGRSIAVDGSGNAYVGGATNSTNFPVVNALKSTNGYWNGFITKINPAGSALIFSTYIGGSGIDELNALALDGSSNIYFAGKATSLDFPLTNPVQSTGAGGLFRSTDSGATWSIAQTGLKNWAYSVAIDRNNPLKMYAGTNGKGLFRSTDGGQTWLTTSQTSDTIYEVVIDPSNSATVYARGSSIYKSTNSGLTFTFLASAPFFPSGMAVDPVNSGTLYAGDFNGVKKSVDGGTTWTVASSGLSGSVKALAIDPMNPQTLYAATSTSLFKTTNGGGAWSDSSGGNDFSTFSGARIVIDPVNTGNVYVGVDFKGVFKTTNAGVSWTALGGLPSGQFSGIAIASSNPTLLYASVRYQGLYKSTDGGATWTLSGFSGVQVESVAVHPTISANVFLCGSTSDAFAGRLNAAGTALDYSTYLGGLFDDSATAIAVDSTGNAIVVGDTNSADFPTMSPMQATFGGATDAFVVKLTSTGARSFATFVGGSGTDNSRAVALDSSGNVVLVGKTVSTDFPTLNALQSEGAGFLRKTVDSGASWQARSRGLPSRPAALAVQPNNSNYLLAGTFKGIFISSDGGYHWAAPVSLGGVGIPALVFDPSTPTTAYAGTTGGVFKSTNSGVSWTAANNGLTNIDVQCLAIGGGVLFAGTNTAGIFKSTDGAATWTAANNGLTNLAIRGIAVHPKTAGTLFAATGGGVFKSTDSGGTWTLSSSGLTNTDVREAAIVRGKPTRMYAATAAGIFLSTDAGSTWTIANSGLLDVDVYSMLISSDGLKVYAAPRSRIFRSTDGAASWISSGLDGTLPQMLAADPIYPNIVYSTTRGASTGFMTRISTSGTLLFSTYFGGSGNDELTAVGLAPNGIIVPAQSNSTDFPTNAILTGTSAVPSAPRWLTALGLSPPASPPPQATPSDTKTTEVSYGVPPRLDLAIDFPEIPVIAPGQSVTVPVKVINKPAPDSSDASNVKLTFVDEYPALSLLGYDALDHGTADPDSPDFHCSGEVRTGGYSIECNLGTMPAGSQLTVRLTLFAGPTSGESEIHAGVTSAGNDQFPEDNGRTRSPVVLGSSWKVDNSTCNMAVNQTCQMTFSHGTDATCTADVDLTVGDPSIVQCGPDPVNHVSHETFTCTGLAPGQTYCDIAITSNDPTTCGPGTTIRVPITVTPPCPTITIMPDTLAELTVGVPIQAIQFSATGGIPPYRNWGVSNTGDIQAAGLSLDLSGGAPVIRGTPTTAGTFTFSVNASDSTSSPPGPCRGSKTYTLTIKAPPPCPTITISPDTLPELTVGVPVPTNPAIEFYAAGGTPPYSWTFTPGLPDGLRLAAHGDLLTLTGTPTVAGTFNVNVSVKDSTPSPPGPCTGSRTYTFTVKPQTLCPTITIAPATLLDLAVGVPIPNSAPITFSATGGTPPYIWTSVIGLPDGLVEDNPLGGHQLSIKGTPTTAGTFNFQVTVFDSTPAPLGRCRTYKVYTLTVKPQGQCPTIMISPDTLPDLTVGVPVPSNPRIEFTATGGTPPYTWSFDHLPDGLSYGYDSDKKVTFIQGTPTTAGTFTLYLFADDSTPPPIGPCKAYKQYTLTIKAQTGCPTITINPESLPDLTVGVPIPGNAPITFSATGGTPPYQWHFLNSLPDGLSYDYDYSNNMEFIKGTPTTVGIFAPIIVYVRDSTPSPIGPCESSLKSYTLTIKAPPKATTTSTLASSPNPATVGQQVTFTNTVAPPGATGSVTYFDGATTLGTGALSIGGSISTSSLRSIQTSGLATFTTSSLSLGTHLITAVYNGDANYRASSSAILQQIVSASPHGDANGDGQVTVADVFYLINALFAGGPAPIGLADANGDGQITVADIFYVINYLFAGGPAPK